MTYTKLNLDFLSWLFFLLHLSGISVPGGCLRYRLSASICLCSNRFHLSAVLQGAQKTIFLQRKSHQHEQVYSIFMPKLNPWRILNWNVLNCYWWKSGCKAFPLPASGLLFLQDFVVNNQSTLIIKYHQKIQQKRFKATFLWKKYITFVVVPVSTSGSCVENKKSGLEKCLKTPLTLNAEVRNNSGLYKQPLTRRCDLELLCWFHCSMSEQANGTILKLISFRFLR